MKTFPLTARTYRAEANHPASIEPVLAERLFSRVMAADLPQPEMVVWVLLHPQYHPLYSAIFDDEDLDGLHLKQLAKQGFANFKSLFEKCKAGLVSK